MSFGKLWGQLWGQSLMISEIYKISKQKGHDYEINRRSRFNSHKIAGNWTKERP